MAIAVLVTVASAVGGSASAQVQLVHPDALRVRPDSMPDYPNPQPTMTSEGPVAYLDNSSVRFRYDQFGETVRAWLYGVLVLPADAVCEMGNRHWGTPVHPGFPSVTPSRVRSGAGRMENLNEPWACGEDVRRLIEAYIGAAGGRGCMLTVGWNDDGSISGFLCCGGSKSLNEVLVEAGLARQYVRDLAAPSGSARLLDIDRRYWSDGTRGTDR